MCMSKNHSLVSVSYNSHTQRDSCNSVYICLHLGHNGSVYLWECIHLTHIRKKQLFGVCHSSSECVRDLSKALWKSAVKICSWRNEGTSVLLYRYQNTERHRTGTGLPSGLKTSSVFTKEGFWGVTGGANCWMCSLPNCQRQKPSPEGAQQRTQVPSAVAWL